MNEYKKLRRGLKDISALFRDKEGMEEEAEMTTPEPEPQIPAYHSNEVTCMAVYNPDQQDDALFMTTYLASKMATSSHGSAVLSINHPSAPAQIQTGLTRNGAYGVDIPESFYTQRVKRVFFNIDQFKTACRPNGPSPEANSVTSLFLQFDYLESGVVQKAMPMIDKWILVIKPDFQNISDIYKMIKTCSFYNNHMEYYLLYFGNVEDPRGAYVFEKLSEMISRRLGIHLVWLGNVFYPEGKSALASDLMLEHLFLKRIQSSDSIEKRALAAYVQAARGAAPNSVAI